jgi:hypothetical protein
VWSANEFACSISPSYAREREDRQAGRQQDAVVELLGDPHRLFCPRPHSQVVGAVQAVGRELDRERNGLGRLVVPQLRDRGREPRMRLLVASEQPLDSRAHDRQPDAQRVCLGRHDPDALDQRRVALGEPARGGQRGRAREQQLDPFLGRGILGEDAERTVEPARRACRSRLDRRLAGLPQRRDRERIPLSRGKLDVVGTRRRRRAAREQVGGASFVRPEPPAAGCRFVDGPAHERVPEAKAPGHVGRPHRVEPQQLVERVENRRLRPVRRSRHELRIEGVAGHCGAFEHTSCVRGDESKLLRQRRGHRGWDVHAAQHDRLGRTPRGRAGAVEHAGELLEVEGVAAALLVQRLRIVAADVLAEQLVGLRPCQRGQVEPVERCGAFGASERAREPLWHLVRPDAEREQHAFSRRPLEQRAEKLDRRRVRPVQVVEHEHERLPARKDVQQLAHRAMTAVALALESSVPACIRGEERGEDERELRTRLVGEPARPLRLEPFDVLLERVDEHPERHVALELGGGAAQRRMPAPVGAVEELGE